MTDHSELVARLRGTPLYEAWGEASDMPEQAAAAIEALAKENAALTVRTEEAERACDGWRNDYRALEKAIVGDTGLSAMLIATQARLFKPRAEAAEAKVARDSDLILDAYKAILVLHRILDKIGLDAGTRAAHQIADRIVAAHPEVIGRAALREIGDGNG